MSALIYPGLPGLGFDVVRSPAFNTLSQRALSGKRTSVQTRLYPLWTFQLVYNLLRDTGAPAFPAINPSEIKTLAGFFNSMLGKFDTFLFTDPDFNTVTNMAFATTDGSTVNYQLTATYGAQGFGAADIVQNLNSTNGAALIYANRYGANELLSITTRTNLLLQSQTLATTWTQNAVTTTNAAGTAPDGTNTACTVKETTATSVHDVAQAVTVPSAAEDVTLSAWLNPNLTRGWGFLQMTEATGSTSVLAYYNLSGNGSIGTVTAGANWSAPAATIQKATNGFYYVTLNATKTNAATSITAAIGPATADVTNSYTGVATNGITAWGAQCEVSLAPTLYLPTTTSGSARVDYGLSAVGIVGLLFTPPANWSLNWSGQFYYRCEFEDDSVDWTKFMNLLWNGKLKFTSVIL